MRAFILDEATIAKSIETYGKEKQSVVCMEECSELIQCISKEVRGKSDIAHLEEEMADIIICLEMLRQMYGVDLNNVQDWILSKASRMERRMAEYEQTNGCR